MKTFHEPKDVMDRPTAASFFHHVVAAVVWTVTKEKRRGGVGLTAAINTSLTSLSFSSALARRHSRAH